MGYFVLQQFPVLATFSVKQANSSLVRNLLLITKTKHRNLRTEHSHVEENTTKQERFPVSIILERREVQKGALSIPQWSAIGVVAGESVVNPDERYSIIRSDEEGMETLWPGFSLVLFKDNSDSYWYNLTAASPSLFVICHQDDEEEIVPVHVSANYDEAGAHMESDDIVFSAPMPPEIYQWVEKFVLDNYQPEKPRKRKRENWVKQEKHAR